MVELLYNGLRVSADDDTHIVAQIITPEGEDVVEGEVIFKIKDTDISTVGIYESDNEVWDFTIPKCELSGRYFYSVSLNGETLCSPQAIYFV